MREPPNGSFARCCRLPHINLPRSSMSIRATPIRLPSKSRRKKVLPVTSQLRQCKYLNNIIEQDHRFIKRRVNPGLGFSGFNTARRTIKVYEAMNMIRKGQIEGVERKDIRGQVGFVAGLFRIAA